MIPKINQYYVHQGQTTIHRPIYDTNLSIERKTPQKHPKLQITHYHSHKGKGNQ